MVGIPSTAFADSMSTTLGVGNDTSMSGSVPPTGITSIANGNGYYGPYATVDLLLGNGSNGVANGAIRVTVNVASGYGMFGSQGAFAFNLANGLTAADVNIAFGTAGYASAGAGQMSAFGKFEYTISDGNAPGHTGPGALVFTLAKNTGTFSSVNDIVELSTGTAAGGYGNFAIKIGKLDPATGNTSFVANITNADGSITQGTGFARDGSGPKPVPEPTSLLMLGSGLLLAPLARKLLRRR